jgi:hypothetical protein
MSKQFFYVQLKFIPKNDIHTAPIPHNRKVIIEVPKDLLQNHQLESTTENSGEEIMALELARRAALGTFRTVEERVAGMYDEGVPFWYENRPDIMNERPCDHEDNGTRAWRIV